MLHVSLTVFFTLSIPALSLRVCWANNVPSLVCLAHTDAVVSNTNGLTAIHYGDLHKRMKNKSLHVLY